MADASAPGPEAHIRRLYERAETHAAKASEELVGSGGFSGLLGQLAENAAAVTKPSSDGMDLVLRNLRVAGRRDVVRLARQLARTEDKLERVLQEVEQLRDELARAGAEAQSLCGQGEEGQDVTRVSRPWLRASEVLMSAPRTLARLPRATLEFANVSLTTPDAPIGQAPRDVVWAHRGTTLYRYYGEARRPCTEAITTKRTLAGGT